MEEVLKVWQQRAVIPCKIYYERKMTYDEK